MAGNEKHKGLTLAEVETRARQMIQRACPEALMDIETLTTCRETGRVFIVLKCKNVQADPAALLTRS
jgi:hypothetical protein